MRVSELKTELLKMIEKENDIQILNALHTFLEKTRINPVLKKKLSSRALKAEDDIAAGRLLSKEEMIKHTNDHLGQ